MLDISKKVLNKVNTYAEVLKKNPKDEDAQMKFQKYSKLLSKNELKYDAMISHPLNILRFYLKSLYPSSQVCKEEQSLLPLIFEHLNHKSVALQT